MKYLILFIYTLFLVSTSNAMRSKIEDQISLSDQNDHKQLKEGIFLILFWMNKDISVARNQIANINDWVTIEDEFLSMIRKIVDTYVYQNNSKSKSKFKDFDFQTQKELFELIFNFVLNLYNKNSSIYPKLDTIIYDYFKKIGNSLVYPNWVDDAKIRKIINAFYFTYDQIFYEIENFNEDEPLGQIAQCIGELILRSMRAFLLSKDEFNYFFMYDTIFEIITDHFLGALTFFVENTNDENFVPFMCLIVNTNTFMLIKELVKYACNDYNDCDSKKATKFILTNFQNIMFKELHYCLTKDSYCMGASLFPNYLTFGNLFFNIENLDKFEEVDKVYKRLNSESFSLLDFFYLLRETKIANKIITKNESNSEEYIFQKFDLLNFFKGFAKRYSKESNDKIYSQIKEQTHLIFQIETHLKIFLHVKINNLIYYLEKYGFEYLTAQIFEYMYDNPEEFSSHREFKKLKNFLNDFLLNYFRYENLKIKTEIESTLINLAHYIYKFISPIDELNLLKKNINLYYFSQIKNNLIEYFSENLTFRNVQKVHLTIMKHDFKLLGEMFSNLFFSLFPDKKQSISSEL